LIFGEAVILKPTTLKIALGLTCVALPVGGFLTTIWQVQLLTITNQLIHLLGAVVAAALTWLWLRCLVTIID
jgi:hypothetical protein